jgi:hypothetical protein
MPAKKPTIACAQRSATAAGWADTPVRYRIPIAKTTALWHRTTRGLGCAARRVHSRCACARCVRPRRCAVEQLTASCAAPKGAFRTARHPWHQKYTCCSRAPCGSRPPFGNTFQWLSNRDSIGVRIPHSLSPTTALECASRKDSQTRQRRSMVFQRLCKRGSVGMWRSNSLPIRSVSVRILTGLQTQRHACVVHSVEPMRSFLDSSRLACIADSMVSAQRIAHQPPQALHTIGEIAAIARAQRSAGCTG